MKASTLIGILLGLLAIFGAYFMEGGKFGALFFLPPMLIVFGGTIAAGIAGSSVMKVAQIPKLFLITLRPMHYNKKALMERIVSLSMLARKEGILTLEKKIEKEEDPHLKKFIQITIDNSNLEVFDEIVESEIHYLTQRHLENIHLFTKLGGYAPTMGLIGTVMGITSALANAGGDPIDLIHNIASALIATLWGILSANMIWLPISDKLKFLHEQEINHINFIVDGIRGLQKGDTPTMIRERLISSFPVSEQKQFVRKK